MCPHDRLTAEPLTYFYGDNTNTNAIEIQIWCALIALLLLQVVHKEQKSKMAFSHTCSYRKAAPYELCILIIHH